MSRKGILFLILFIPYIFTVKTFASNIKINEVLVHPSSGNKEWVEFYNPDKIDLSGYWIDDDADFTSDAGSSSKRKLQEIAGIDTQYPYYELSSSMFNNSGDDVVLFGADGTIIDQYHYDKDPGADISIGRSPDASGNFAILQAVTKGSANSIAQPTETLTPTDTPKPTPTPKTTHTTTPKPATNTPVDSSRNAQITAVEYSSQSLSPSTATTEESSDSADILGASASAVPPVTHAVSKPSKKTLVASARDDKRWAYIALAGAGLVLIVSCGILAFLKWKSMHMGINDA